MEGLGVEMHVAWQLSKTNSGQHACMVRMIWVSPRRKRFLAKKIGRLCHKRTVGTRVAQRRGLFMYLRARREQRKTIGAKKTILKKKPYN